MKNSRTALEWWRWVVMTGVILFVLAFLLVLRMFGPHSIGATYYGLGLFALALLFAYLAGVARVTILVRTRTLKTNPAAANRRTLMILATTLLLPASIVLIIALFGSVIGELLS